MNEHIPRRDFEAAMLVRHLIEPAEGIHNFAPRAFER